MGSPPLAPFLRPTASQKSKKAGDLVSMTAYTTSRTGVLRLLVVTVHITGKHMTGCTKLPPVRSPPYGNIILSVDTSPQQPFIWGTVGFMAIGAGKNIVISFTKRIRGYNVTFAIRFIALFFSVYVSACSPINL
jgi:hypothetical protein